MRVLALDGGGSKGFFTLEVLRYLELTCGRPIRECFDLIVGTSVGGFIAGCLVAGKSVDEIEAEFLPVIGVFSKVARPSARTAVSRFLWGHILDASDWATHVETLLGNLSLQELPESPRLLLVAADASTVVPHPFLFRTRPLSDIAASRSPFATTTDIRLVDALRATTAAPTIYPAYVHNGKPIVDGGILANNPILLALAEVNLLGKTLDCVVSIGTGVEPRPTTSTSTRGILGWTWALVKRATDSDTAADVALGLLHPSQYFRFDPPTVGECNTWESNPDVLRRWRIEVQDYMHGHQETLASLVARLFPPAQDNEDRPVSNGGGPGCPVSGGTVSRGSDHLSE